MRRPLRHLLRAVSAALLAVAVATTGVEASPSARTPAAAAATAKAKTGRAKAGAKKARGKAAKAGSARGGSRTKAKASGTSTRRTKAKASTTRRGKSSTRGRASARATASRTKSNRTRVAERRAARAVVERPAAPPTIPTTVPTVDLATALGADLVTLPDVAARPTGGTAAPMRPFEALSRSATSMIDEMVNRARSQLGTRYVFGGARPGESLDCSSFARYAMEALGFRLPRTADEQSRLGRAVPRDQAALKPGDLLTFGTRRRVDHVGIYLGEGRFIHASVKSGQVIETTIARNGSLFRKWLGARRLIADADSARPTGG